MATLILCKVLLADVLCRLLTIFSWHRTCNRGQQTKKDPARVLSKEHCDAALEIFNNYNHSEKNLAIIEPVMLEVLQSAILGMCEVEHYFSYSGQKLDFPKELYVRDYIYIGNCSN